MITDTAILLYLIRHYELSGEPEIRELILAEGEWYLKQGEWQEDGTLFYHGQDRKANKQKREQNRTE